MGFKNIPPGQSWLTQRAQKLGYKSNTGGICYGDAHMFMQAVLSEDIDSFDKRLELISNIPVDLFKPKKNESIKAHAERVLRKLPDDIHDEVIKAIEEKEPSIKTLEEVERQKAIKKAFLANWVAIHAFFDGLEIYFQSGLYKNLYLKHEHIKAQLPDLGLKLVTPQRFDGQKMGEQGPFALCSSFSGSYTKEDLVGYFTSLQEQLYEAKGPVGIVLNAGKHTISLGYDSKNEQWRFRNSNRSPSEIISKENLEHLASRVMVGFGAKNPKNRVIFASTIYVHRTNEDKVKKSIEAWKESDSYKQIHDTNDKKRRKAEDPRWGTNWLYIAARSGDKDSLEKLIAHMGEEINTPPKNIQSWNPLRIAAEFGHDECCELLLNHSNIDAAIKDEDGNTFMHTALSTGDHPNFVRLYPNFINHLENKNKLLDEKNKDGLDIKDYALEKGCIKFLTELLGTISVEDLMAYLNKKRPEDWENNRNVGQALLRMAIETGSAEIVKNLLNRIPEGDRKEFINRLYPTEGSVLHIAASLGYADILKVLLDNKAEVIKDYDKTFVDIALEDNNFKLFDSLEELEPGIREKYNIKFKIEAKQKQLQQIENLNELFKQVAKKDSNVETQKRLTNNPSLALMKGLKKQTVLHRAVLAKNSKITEFLLNLKGIKEKNLEKLIYRKDKNGNTALHLAAKSNDFESVVLILKNTENPEKLLFEKNKYGQTALHLAAKYGNAAIIKKLLANSGDNKVNYLLLRDNVDCNALHYAAEKGKTDNIKILLDEAYWENKGDKKQRFLFRRNDNNATPLHFAALHGDENTVRALLSPLKDEQKKQYLRMPDDDNEISLHYAARNNGRIVGLLIKEGYLDNLNDYLSLKNDSYQTPLQVAVVENKAGPLKILLEADSRLSQTQQQFKEGPKGGDLLYLAAEQNSHKSLKTLLADVRQLDINTLNKIEKTVLYAAAAYGHKKIVKSLLKNFKDLDIEQVIRDLLYDENEKAISLIGKYLSAKKKTSVESKILGFKFATQQPLAQPVPNVVQPLANVLQPVTQSKPGGRQPSDDRQQPIVTELRQPVRKVKKSKVKSSNSSILKDILSGAAISFVVSAVLLLAVVVPLLIYFGISLTPVFIGVAVGVTICTVVGGAFSGIYNHINPKSDVSNSEPSDLQLIINDSETSPENYGISYGLMNNMFKIVSNKSETVDTTMLDPSVPKNQDIVKSKRPARPEQASSSEEEFGHRLK